MGNPARSCRRAAGGRSFGADPMNSHTEDPVMTQNAAPHAPSIRSAIALAALLLLAGATPGVAPAHAQVPADAAARVDELMAAYAGDVTPGAVVAVVRNGEIVFQRAYGMANLTHGIPFTTATVTNIGSTSKQFTAFAILLLESRGLLSLDDDIRTHIPELPDFGETVKLRHFITHTSGYREFLNALAIGGWNLAEGDWIDRDAIIELVQRQPRLQNSPGAEYNYNNTGYALLATVVERVTGESFPAWMASNVFEPLGMRHTVVRGEPRQIVPNASQGYRPAGENGFRQANDLAGAMGAGGIYTTVGDLARWMNNFRTAELGGRAVVDRMTERNVLTTGDTTSYAMGLMVAATRGLRMVQHGGADAAHRSTFIMFPDLDAGLIVQSNHAAFETSIPGRITEIFFGEQMEPREDPAGPALPAEPVEFDPAAYDPASFDVFVGRYALEVQPDFVLSFRREGDRLLTQATGQPSFEIQPTSDSTFRLLAVPASVTFHRDADGQVTGLTLHQNGHHRANRLPGDAPVVDVTPFAGRYYSAELETFYTLAVVDGELVARHRRLPPVTLRHVEGDRFAGGPPLARIDFERGADGTVTGFRVDNARARDILFERKQ
jgi:CubicO group peptidase (beta-lactamase class C family)